MSQAVPPLELATMASVSPSLAELLRLCALRAGLSRVRAASVLIIGNPKAWLGRAYHEVLAAAGRHAGDAGVANVWDQAIGQQHERAETHPLDRRFGVPEDWPGYHLTRAMALMRAQELAPLGPPKATTVGAAPCDGGCHNVGGHEKWLTASSGRLVGRPDLLRDNAVIDYKTGDVFEHGEDDVVKASYIRQLQIYAFLVRESTGRWPTRGVLLPMEGPPVEIDIEPSACECVAAEALDLLDRYNNEILTQPNSADFANPSPDTCRWCPYQLVCPSFWSAADESWSEQFGSAALAGLASSGPVPIHGGSAFTLSLNVDEGTEVANVVGLAPLRSEDHLALSRVQQGTHVRVVGLAKRADGTVLPTKRTVIARTEDLPEIVVVQSAASTTSSAST